MNKMPLFRRPSLMALVLLMSMGAAARPAAEPAGAAPAPLGVPVAAPAIEVNHQRLDAAFLAVGKPADLSERDWQALQRTVAKSFTQDTQISNNLSGRDAEYNEYMGVSVAVDGDTAVIGASRDDLVNGDSGSARVYVRSGSTWTLQTKLVPSTLQINCCQRFGYSVAISGNSIVVGAWNDSGNYGQGAVYVFTRSAGVWSQQARLVNAEGSVYHNYFGQAVDIDADTLVVGTPRAYGPGNVCCEQGTAQVFVRSGGSWALQQVLRHPSPNSSDYFGSGVGVSGDRIVVGARWDDVAFGDQGSAQVYTRSGAVWSHQAQLVASDASGSDWFGTAVAIDGTTIAVGALRDTPGGACCNDTGSVYPFFWNGSAWVQQGRLNGSTASGSDQYVGSIDVDYEMAVSVSGDTIVYGAPRDDAAFTDQGSAYVFTRTAGVWSQQGGPLYAGDAQSSDIFGYKVAVSGDSVLAGSPFDDTYGNCCDMGSAYAYTRTAGVWSQQQKLDAGLLTSNDQLGYAVDVQGTTAVIGAPREDHTSGCCDQGAAYVYVLGAGVWTLQQRLVASDAASSDYFGWSVALDGDSVVVGAVYEDPGAVSSAGSAYVFTRSGGVWSEQQKLSAADAANNDVFGWSVALQGDRAVIGAYLDDSAYVDQGAAYVFERSAGVWSQQAKLVAADGAQSDQFGFDVALDGGSIAVGAINADGTPPFGDPNAGAIYVYTGSGASWTLQQKLGATAASNSDQLGYSVAIDGDWLVAGAPNADRSGNCCDEGAALVFARSGGVWSESARLEAADGDSSDQFGWAVDIDNERIVVGARLDDIGSFYDYGSLYFFVRDGAAWLEQAKFVPGNLTQSSQSGHAVALSGDVVIAGAPYADGVAPFYQQDVGVATIFSFDPDPTTTTITSDAPDASVVGQAVTVAFDVNSAQGTPTGSVTVTATGGLSCGPVTLAAGQGSCQITPLAAGALSISATFTPNNFTHLVSADNEAHTVNASATATTVSVPVGTAVVGEAYLATVAVSAAAPGSGTPTGSVIVSDGTDSCPITLPAVSCSLTSTTPGTKAITATFTPDTANYLGSSGSTGKAVAKAATSVAVSDGNDPSQPGESYPVTVTVGAVAPGAGSPSGTISISDGIDSCGFTIGVATSCNLVSTTAGPKTLTATYSGDGNFFGSSGATGHVVSRGTTATTIASITPTPAFVGQSYTVLVNVAAVAPASGTPTGSISVSDGAASCLIALPANSCALSSATAGAKTVTATYLGDANFAASSDSEAHNVNRRTPTVAITDDSPDASEVGASVSVAVSVTGAGPTPTGTVTVSDGADTCSFDLPASGCALTLNQSGARTLTASYGGDANYSAASDTEAHNVNARTPVVNISAHTPSPSLTSQAVSVSVAVTGSGATPTGTVSVGDGVDACTIILPAGSCSLTLSTAGTRTITATYSGDSVYAGGSDSESHIVNQRTPTVQILNDAPDASLVNETVTVSVSVSGSGLAPTGTISVGDGIDSCLITLPASSCDLAFTTAGARTITATYSGDAAFLGGTDGESHQVNKRTPQVTISSDAPDASTPTQSVTVVVAVLGDNTVPGGSITVSDGVDSCGMTLPDNDCDLTLTTLGTRTLTASYGGDAVYLAGADSESHQVAALVPTLAIVSDNPDASLVGETVTVAVSISGSASAPTGTVAISDGVDGCVISLPDLDCDLALGTAGLRTLTATYSGDGLYAGTSATESHQVNKRSVVVTIDGTPDTTTVGQSFPVVVGVSGAGTAPTGTVQVSDGVESCQVTLPATSCDLALTTVGNRTLTASYSGDPQYLGDSATEAHVVTLNPATVTITAHVPDPSQVGQSVTVSATVAGSGGYSPTGTVSVSDGNGNSCLITLPATSCAITLTVAGSNTLTATYSGNAALGGDSDNVSHLVEARSGTLSILSHTPSPSAVGQAYTVSFIVFGNGGFTPTGTVSVSDGAASCGPVTLANGAGQCDLTSTSAGTKTLTATYSGDGNFDATSTATTHIVGRFGSTTSIFADAPDASLVGEAVTVSVSVASQGGPAPTGTINVTAPDAAPCAITVGVDSSCALTFASLGNKTITASYGGDANHEASSDVEQHVVGRPANVGVTKDDGVGSVHPGDTVEYDIVVTNHGATALNGVGVADLLPESLVSGTWTCTPLVGGICPSPSGGFESFSTTVNLAAGGSVRFDVVAMVAPDTVLGSYVTNTANVVVPAGYVDTNQSNDAATDTDEVGSFFADGFEDLSP